MRFFAVLALAACGGSSSHAPAHVDPTSPDKPVSTSGASTAAEAPPAAPLKFPEPPAGSAPTGTWRVTLEFPRLLGRPAGIVSDATGVYLTGAILSADDVRFRRWALVKLDTSGATKWSNVSELARSPAPQRIVLADGGVVVAGQDDEHEAARLLLIERRDLTSGKRQWQRRFTARDAKCTSVGCAGKDTFGGISVRGSSLLYIATVDRPLEEAYGDLSLAKGEPGKGNQSLSDLRGRDIAGDDSGLYLLQENLSGAISLLKLAPDGKPAWKKGQKDIESGATRFALIGGNVLLWGKTIEMRSGETGDVVWMSKLAGEHLDVAVDATGIYATVMIDAKPAPYFAIAKLDPASGAVQWLRHTSEYSENRPTAYIAVDKDAIYLFGYDAEKWLVERRRKSDGALGEVNATARTVEGSITKK